MSKIYSFHIIILWLALLSFIHSYIIIPFNSLDHNIPKNLEKTEDVLAYFSKAEYATFLKIGTPPQEILMFITSSDYNFDILYHSYQNKGPISEFFPYKSSTYIEKTSEVYKISYHKVFPAKDVIYLPTVNEFKQLNNVCSKNGDYNSFFEKYNDIEFFYSPFYEPYSSTAGTIGLLQEKTRNDSVPHLNFLLQVKNKANLETLVYSYVFDTIGKGKLVIGKLPHEYDVDNFKKENYIEKNIDYEKKNYYDHLIYKVQFQNAFFEFEKSKGKKEKVILETPGDKYIIIDPDYYITRVPDIYMKKILSTYFKKYFNERICRLKSAHIAKIYVCDKNKFTIDDMKKFPPLQLYVKDFNSTFELGYEELFREQGDEYIFMVTNNLYEQNNFILGKILLKKYRFTFNPENKVLGYYKYEKKVVIESPSFFSTTKGYIILGLSAFFILLLIIIIIYCFIKRKNQKKRGKVNKKNYDDNDDNTLDQIDEEEKELEDL